MAESKPIQRGTQAQEIASSQDGDLHPDEKYSWFRGVFFQATVVGVAAFTAPGLWNAMNSVGAGGQQTPYLVMYVLALASSQRRVIQYYVSGGLLTPITCL
jgi:hypothetical protein